MATFQNLTVGTIHRVGDRAASAGPQVLDRDASGNALLVSGTSVPANALAGYAVGCEFIKADAATGQCARWRNHGTAASSAFRPSGPVIGYGFAAAGNRVFVSGTAGLIVPADGTVAGGDIALATHSASDDNDQIIAVLAANSSVTVTNSADPLSAHAAAWAVLRSGCTPGWDIFAAGTHTTAGGNAAEAITITGALATDIALVQYAATDDTDTIAKAVMTANTLTVTMSADPSTTHALHYCILRPRGSFRPSHYVAAAGTHTTAGGAVAEAITVAGALATDVAIVNYAVTNDSDAIRKAVVTAGVLTVTMSADPSTAHALSYALLRAY